MSDHKVEYRLDYHHYDSDSIQVMITIPTLNKLEALEDTLYALQSIGEDLSKDRIGDEAAENRIRIALGRLSAKLQEGEL